MDWDDLRHFAAFAATGSLSAAARRLRVEHATVARRVAALEARLGLKLVDRRGRRLVLTTDGERVAAVAGRMESDMQALERQAHGTRSDLSGEVTISAPSAYAATVLVPKLAGLRRRHPGLAIRLLGEARTASLERREADVAIRLSRPEAGDLTILKLADMPFRLYGSAAYLAATPENEWSYIGSDGPMAGSPQQGVLDKRSAGRGFGLRSDHAEIQYAWALADGGIAMLPDFMVEGGASLVAARPSDPPLMRPVWLAVHSDMKAAAPIRAVIECLRADGPGEGHDGGARHAPER